MEHERPGPFPRATIEQRLRPRIALQFGASELLEPGTDRFPVGFACDWINYLLKLDPARYDAYERARHFSYQAEQGEGQEIERNHIYEIFRSFGISKEGILALADAARADSQAPGDGVAHRVAVLKRLIIAERVAGLELVSFGAVLAQTQKVAEAVVGYALDHKLAEGVQRNFAVQFFGPIEAFVLAAASVQSSVPKKPLQTGCFNLDDRMIRIPVDAETLDQGLLSQTGIETAAHEMVHAISPNRVQRKLEPDGGSAPRKIRSGFYSSVAGNRRRPVALLALNEGVTESMARAAYAADRIGPPWAGDIYASYVEDVATLRELADLSEDELFRIYLSEDGVLELGKLLRERTALGPHGLSLFDIFSREAAGGFTRFLDTMRRYHAGLPYKHIELDKSHLVTKRAGDGDRLTHPPLSPELIEQSFPFVHIRKDD